MKVVRTGGSPGRVARVVVAVLAIAILGPLMQLAAPPAAQANDDARADNLAVLRSTANGDRALYHEGSASGLAGAGSVAFDAAFDIDMTASGDFDGDGHADLVAVRTKPDGRDRVLVYAGADGDLADSGAVFIDPWFDVLAVAGGAVSYTHLTLPTICSV